MASEPAKPMKGVRFSLKTGATAKVSAVVVGPSTSRARSRPMAWLARLMACPLSPALSRSITLTLLPWMPPLALASSTANWMACWNTAPANEAGPVMAWMDTTVMSSAAWAAKAAQASSSAPADLLERRVGMVVS